MELTEEELRECRKLKLQKETQYAAIKRYMAKNQAMRLYHSCKQRAKLQGIEFSLSLEDIVIPKVCPYLEIPITNIFGEGRIFSNASIDRIDPSKGYTKENIQVMSDLANRMKQNATEEQLLTFARKIIELHTRT